MPTHMLGTLFDCGPDAYLNEVRELEKSDSALRKYPRVKVHDDATIITLHRGGNQVER